MTLNSACRIVATMVALTCSIAAQDEKPWQFPSASLPQMDAALSQFTQAQAQGRWDDVGELLGEYRRGLASYMRYTETHKQCLVASMKEWPMVSFDYRIQESPFSSEILSTPPERRWWTLVGDATFQTASGLITRQTAVIAYRDGKHWYFTPPPFDNAALGKEVTERELAKDRAGSVEIRIPPDAPLQLSALHVHIDPENLTSRNVEFRFHNTTERQITGYSFALDDVKNNGSISDGTGAERDRIQPRGDSRVWNENYNAFLYRCEGEANIRITLQDVTFEDGTRWKPKTTSIDSTTSDSQ